VREFVADLHIHTALSPCASDELTPPRIVGAALERGLDLIAICDHNTAGNARAVQQAAGYRLAVIAGLELMTVEEIHIVGLFPSANAAERAAETLLASLPRLKGRHREKSSQWVMSEDGRVIGREQHMLSAATRLNVAEGVALIRRHHGLAVAAHVNRPLFSVTSQLGMLPLDARFDALEVFVGGRFAGAEREWERTGLPLLFSSDSHSLEEIGAVRTSLRMKEPTFHELALAVQGHEGRKCATCPSTSWT